MLLRADAPAGGLPPLPKQLNEQQLYEMQRGGVSRCYKQHVSIYMTTCTVHAAEHDFSPSCSFMVAPSRSCTPSPMHGWCREDAVAALEVTDNDGDAAMLYHVTNLNKGGAAKAGPPTFIDRMVDADIAKCGEMRRQLLLCQHALPCSVLPSGSMLTVTHTVALLAVLHVLTRALESILFSRSAAEAALRQCGGRGREAMLLALHCKGHGTDIISVLSSSTSFIGIRPQHYAQAGTDG